MAKIKRILAVCLMLFASIGATAVVATPKADAAWGTYCQAFPGPDMCCNIDWVRVNGIWELRITRCYYVY